MCACSAISLRLKHTTILTNQWQFIDNLRLAYFFGEIVESIEWFVGGWIDAQPGLEYLVNMLSHV